MCGFNDFVSDNSTFILTFFGLLGGACSGCLMCSQHFLILVHLVMPNKFHHPLPLWGLLFQGRLLIPAPVQLIQVHLDGVVSYQVNLNLAAVVAQQVRSRKQISNVNLVVLGDPECCPCGY